MPNPQVRWPTPEFGLSKTQVFETLVEEILTGVLKPNEPLVERALGERFGISRTPVREVLQRLHSEYLLEFIPNHGAYVKRLTTKDVRELFQVREAIEPMAASLAARNRPDDEVAEFSVKLRPTRTVQRSTASELTLLGQSFHDAIAAWANNDLLRDIYSTLRRQTRLIRTLTRTSHGVEVVSFNEHCSILTAIQARDDVRAHRLMLEHLTRTSRVVLALVST